ncbi:inactive beta-amylase 9 [Hibiscus syriacus]|uniref:Inactive beta-amylase 9 n=1 Tax=Hibiscus syriacus TaxID=106335 RepID=A0A6A3D9M6_HIBSY|nr:inactive beta-amylase 9 [Hibiscus syriacus]
MIIEIDNFKLGIPPIQTVGFEARPTAQIAGCILAELLAGRLFMPGRTEFFMTKPYACYPSSLPKYPPCKEMDSKLRDEEATLNIDGVKKTRPRDPAVRAIPAPEANAELQPNLDACRRSPLFPLDLALARRRMITQTNAKSKSEKFPPPHQDGTLGYPLAPIQTWSGPLMDSSGVGAPRRKKHMSDDGHSHSKSSKREEFVSNIARRCITWLPTKP